MDMSLGEGGGVAMVMLVSTCRLCSPFTARHHNHDREIQF